MYPSAALLNWLYFSRGSAKHRAGRSCRRRTTLLPRHTRRRPVPMVGIGPGLRREDKKVLAPSLSSCVITFLRRCTSDIDPQSGCRLPLPRREDLDAGGQRIYDSLADPEGGTLRGLRGPGGILLHSPDLSRYARSLNRYLRHESGLG